MRKSISTAFSGDNPKDKIEVFVVVRVNISDKPAGCIAQVTSRETANLPQFGFILWTAKQS